MLAHVCPLAIALLLTLSGTATAASPAGWSPHIDPAAFVTVIDHPYFPHVPGTVMTYEGVSDGEEETVTYEVTAETREVMGVTCTVVRDTVTVDGELVEDTYDWFAQDRDGNVWYFGEASQDYEDGEPAGTEGSWEAGIDGALPGIIMPAEPEVGVPYYQEFYPGEAEDMAKVIATDGEVTVAYGTFSEVLVIEEWNPLEPGVIEHKHYAPGIGLVLEETVEGGEGRLELVGIESPGTPAR